MTGGVCGIFLGGWGGSENILCGGETGITLGASG